MQHFELRVPAGAAKRLDHFLVQALPEFSRSRLQALIRAGGVRIDAAVARKAGQIIEPGSVIELDLHDTAPTRLVAEDIPLDVLYEDADVLVVNKQAGMTVHPGAGHTNGTLASAALGHAPTMEGIGGQERPGVVHRLDKDTSGVIILAKNDYTLRWLQRQFHDREVVKTYLALVDGRPPSPRGRVEAAIGRDLTHRKRMAIVLAGKGRSAVSEYVVREEFRSHSLLEVRPLTGRTHQVRLHCAFLGCPVVGDKVYGRAKSSLPIQRHFLHAWKLRLVLPSENVQREFEAALPEELMSVLSTLRSGAAVPLD